MKIFDITDQIKINKSNNYVFNNSLIHLQDNLFIMVYRNIIYNIDELTHPWKFWNDSYKIMLKYNPDIVKNNQHLNVNFKLFNLSKYRNHLSHDHFVKLFKFKDNTIFNNDEKSIEFDGTGLCVLKYINDTFIVKFNVNNIFDRNMNQDARLYKFNDELYLTYNSFIIHNNDLFVKMIKRKFTIDLNDNFLYLYPECELLTIKHKSVEKNCILLDNHNVLYNIDKKFIIQNNNTKIIIKSKILDHINTRFNNIFISLGTPVIKFDNQYISVGHMKIEYKNNKNIYLTKFLKNIDLDKIKLHGRYLYFAFIFIFDHNYNIKFISDFFIPSINEDYLPYLLVFPTGLTYYNDKYYISYGEGDDKCKILELSKNDILNILKKYNQELIILKPDDLKPRILHLGYFNKWNCGDDCFMNVFNYLHSLTNNNKYIIDYQDKGYNYKSIILGGGDVINPYFCNNRLLDYSYIKKIACGVGLPYLDQLHLLDKFDKVILRNSNDLIKFNNNNYIAQPDLVYLMMKYYKPLNLFDNKKDVYKIGLSLPRTYYNKDYIDEYKNLIIELYKFIKLLKNNDNYIKLEIYLIPFGINNMSVTENDNILNKHLFELLSNETIIIHNYTNIIIKESNNIFLCEIYKHDHYYYDILNLVNSVDFMICGRFHSHIFSIMCNKLFISLSCSRKCIELMNEYDMNDYIYKYKTNDIIIPIEFNHLEFYEWFKNIKENNLTNKINNIHNNILNKLDDMINIWFDIYNFINE
jgi:predicted GH43/DUF377 family glycosyl hydrolase